VKAAGWVGDETTVAGNVGRNLRYILGTHCQKKKEYVYLAEDRRSNYAISQTESLNKSMHHTIFLTRRQINKILKEKEVDFSEEEVMEYTKGEWALRKLKEDVFGLLYGDDTNDGFDFGIDLSPSQIIELVDFIFDGTPVFKSAPKLYEALKEALEKSHNPEVEKILMAALAEAEDK